MRVGSLFAGVGGFDLAAERAGMEVVFSSEIDRYANLVLERRFPNVPNLGDVHEIGVEDAAGVDVLAGGFPCQDYSVAGPRSGLAGDRGALWWEFHRLVDEVRPRWVVGENVRGLLGSRGGRDFGTIVDSLVDLGYGVVWAVLDARWFGVPQRRERVFLVGHSGGVPRPRALALGEGLFGHPRPSREERPSSPDGTPGSTVAGFRKATRYGADKGFERWERDDVSNSLTRQGDTGVVRALKVRAGETGPDLDDAEAGHLYRLQSFGQYVEDDVASTMQSRDWKYVTDVVTRQAVVRRLTPLECERLQGFPDGWTDVPGSTPAQRRKQMGNAVAVPVAEWIMRRIMEEDN